jgi:hypothetical protein
MIFFGKAGRGKGGAQIGPSKSIVMHSLVPFFKKKPGTTHSDKKGRKTK